MLSPILACVDVARAIDYYTQKLSFSVAFSLPSSTTGEPEFACVTLGDAEILLGVTEGFVDPADLDKRGIGIQIYVTLPDSVSIDDIYARAQEQGASITKAIATRDWGERSFNVRDLDGYNLMIAQQPKKG